MPTDDLALVADLLDARLDLHGGCLSPLLVPIDDAAAGQVVRRELHDDPVLRQDADVVLAHLAADVGENAVPVGELDAEHGVRQRLDDPALDLDGPFFLGHVLHISRASLFLGKDSLTPGARETAQPTGRTGSLRRRRPAHQTVGGPGNPARTTLSGCAPVVGWSPPGHPAGVTGQTLCWAGTATPRAASRSAP